MSEQVKCERCGKSYTRRGLATHQRACKAVSDLAEAVSSMSLAEAPARVRCPGCGKSFSERGMPAHQRACRAPREEGYVAMYHKYVLGGSMADMPLGSAPPHMPDMHDPEDREEVLIRCQELEAQVSEAQNIRARVSQEMERVGSGMPEGPLVPLQDLIETFVPSRKTGAKSREERIKDQLREHPDETVIIVTRRDGIQSSYENDYVYLVLKYGLKYVPAGKAATRALRVPWPEEREREAYSNRVYANLCQLREIDEDAVRRHEAATGELHAMFSA